MAHLISEECLSCGACAIECPVENCIVERDDRFSIVTELCSDCGQCLPICPVEAISAG